MTYGTVFASTGAVFDEAAMLRKMGLTTEMFLLAADGEGHVDIEPVTV